MTIFQSFYYSASFSCRAVQFSTFNAFQKSSARNAKVPTTLNTFFTLSYVLTLRSYLYMLTAQFKPSFLSFLFISELHHLVVFTTTPPPPLDKHPVYGGPYIFGRMEWINILRLTIGNYATQQIHTLEHLTHTLAGTLEHESTAEVNKSDLPQ